MFRNTRHDASGNVISDVLDASHKTMAEYLQDAGFGTAGLLEQAQLRSYMGLLFQKLKDEGVYDNSLIIITSHHGDEFLEHGSVDHAHTLYDELLRVPLLIPLPQGEA